MNWEAQKSPKCYAYSEIGDSGGPTITQMLCVVKSVILEAQNHPNATYIVKSVILEAQISPKCFVYSEIDDSGGAKSLKRYVYNEIGDSGGPKITQTLRI